MSEGLVRSLVALIAVSSVVPILPAIQSNPFELTPTAAPSAPACCARLLVAAR